MSEVGLIGFHELFPYPVPRAVLARLKPAYHTLFVARDNTSPAEVVNRVNIIHQYSPDTEVIVRVWPDDDVTRLSRGLPDWIEMFGAYLHFDHILMIDNEPAISVDGRLDQIVSSYIEIMDYVGNLGYRICWGAWRPGEPADHDTEYERLLPLFRRNEYWHNRGVEFIYGPHAYFDPSLEWHYKWLNFRQQIFSFDVCDRHNVRRPTTVLTEYGYSRWHDGLGLVPEGYKSLGYSPQRYAETLPGFLEESEFTSGMAVPVTIFSAGEGMGGGWRDFDVHNDAFYSNLPFIPFVGQQLLPTPVPIPVPEPSPPIPLPIPVPTPVPSPTNTKLKLSFGVHHEDFDNELLSMRPPVILTMTGSHHATSLAQQLPETLVIHRGWNDNRLHWDISPERFVENHKHLAEFGVVVHTTNEPPNPNNEDEALRLVLWHENVIRLSAQYNLKLCILNFGAGGPDIDKWGMYDSLLRLVAENRDRVFMGLHEYAVGVIYSGMENIHNIELGSTIDWRDWAGVIYPTLPINTDNYNLWHTGRYKHLLKYCEDNNIDKPQIIFTEYGWDQLTDNISTEYLRELAAEHPPVAPFEHYRGWRSLERVWNEWGNNFSMINQLEWANDNLYTEPEIVGQCLFAVSESPDWKQDFDYSVDEDLIDYMSERYAIEREDTVPIPPVELPDADDELFGEIFDKMLEIERKLDIIMDSWDGFITERENEMDDIVGDVMQIRLNIANRNRNNNGQ